MMKMKNTKKVSVCVSIEKLIREKGNRGFSDCISARLTKSASVLPEGEYVGFRMCVPTKGRVKMEVFGTGSFFESDLEWMAEKVGKVSKSRFASVKEPAVKELYEIVLPAATKSTDRTMGFGASATDPNENELFYGWPVGFGVEFEELIKALQTCGAILLYTAGPADISEQMKAQKILYRTYGLKKISADEYLGAPIKIRFLILLPNSLSIRLRTVLGDSFPKTELHYLGSMEDENIKHIWNHSMEDATVLPQCAACFLFPEPCLKETIPGIETFEEKLPDIPVDHVNANTSKAVVIGNAVDISGRKTEISIPDLDLRRHYQIVGQTGTGKSTLLSNTILSAIEKGYGLTFFDPHGSTIDVVLKSLPKKYMDRVRVVRIGDAANPVPLGMWNSDNPADSERLISDLCELFSEIFDPRREGFVGPRWERWFSVFAKASIALFGSRASFECIEVLSANQHNMKMLYDRIYNEYPEIANQVKNEFGTNESKDFGDLVSWALCKMQRLTSVEQLRNTLGSGVDALRFPETIDTDTVTLIDLGTPAIGSNASRIIGTILLMKLWNAVLERKNRDKTHIVVVDEASLFQTNPMPKMLAESRKFGLSMILCHQHIGQLTTEIRDALDANSANLSAFRLSIRDAHQMSYRFEDEDIIEKLARQDAFKAITTLSVQGRQSSPFTLNIQPPKEQENGEAIKEQIERQSIEKLVKPYEYLKPLTKEEILQVLEKKKAPYKKKDLDLLEELKDLGVEEDIADYEDFDDDVPDDGLGELGDSAPEWLVTWNKQYSGQRKSA